MKMDRKLKKLEYKPLFEGEEGIQKRFGGELWKQRLRNDDGYKGP